jgi:tetratricopeptide (TPR) repeat protein
MRQTRKALAAAAFVFAAISPPAPAVAAPPAKEASTSDKARAADLFKRSADAYRQGDFKQAIELLDEAYALDPQPVLLYNRARAHEGLGHLDEAIAGYEKFLADEPNAPDRGAIEQRLTTLRHQRDERDAREKERAEKKEPAPPAPASVLVHSEPAPPPPHKRSAFPYIVLGTGTAGLIAGTVLGLMATSTNSDAKDEPTQKRAMDLKSDADSLATTSTVFFAVGGVLLLAGATWWLLDRDAAPKSTGNAR